MKIFLIVLAVLVVLGGGAVFWLYGMDKSAPVEESSTTQTSTPASTSTTPATTSTAKSSGTWKQVGPAVSGSFADADTVKLAENSYRLYYAIQPEVVGNKFEVYSATSTDGKTWTQESGTRKTSATFPEVVKLVDGKFRLYFQSGGVIKSAMSTDGLTFTDEAGTRIDKINDLGLTFDNVAAPTVLSLTDGTFVMVYRGTINTPYAGEKVPNPNTQILLWATSTDGLTWTKKGMAIDSRIILYGLADGPELFVSDDDSIKLSFWSYQGVYWSTFANNSFSAPEKVFAIAESTKLNKFPTPTPGDPTYAKFNGAWYMYYGQKDGIYYATAIAK